MIMRRLRALATLCTFLLFIVSIYLSQSYGYGTIQNDLGVGYFCGALCAILGFVFKSLIDENTTFFISDNIFVRIIDSLPFLVMLPLASLVVYAELTGKTSSLFNASSWVSGLLFGVFFWPMIEKIDGK